MSREHECISCCRDWMECRDDPCESEKEYRKGVKDKVDEYSAMFKSFKLPFQLTGDSWSPIDVSADDVFKLLKGLKKKR